MLETSNHAGSLCQCMPLRLLFSRKLIGMHVYACVCVCVSVFVCVLVPEFFSIINFLIAPDYNY